MMLKKLMLGCLSALVLTGCYALESPDMEQYKTYYSKNKVIQKDALTVRFLGTSTLLISDGKTNLMTDGFFTRPGEDRLKLLFGKVETDKALVYRYLKRLNLNYMNSLAAVLVFHSHHDHAMDSAEIAWKTGAKVLGSQSTALIAEGYDLPKDQIVAVKPYHAYHFGDFKVTFIPSKHVPLPGVFEATGMMGTMDKPLRQPASIFDYREGGTYAIHIEHPKGSSMLHGGAYKKGSLKGYQADTIFMCTPGIPKLSPEERENYYNEVVNETGAKRIIPVHWDDFTQSLDKPLVPLPRFAEDLESAMSFLFEKQKKHPDLKIEFLKEWESYQLFPYGQ